MSAERAWRLLAALLCVSLFAGTAAAQMVRDESHVGADGARVLQQSIEVPAEREAVWRAFTTTDGFRSWAAPFASIEFRLGGFIEASYAPASTVGAPTNIRNEIVAFAPLRMLAIRNRQAPPGAPFDAATFQRLHTVILFEPAGSGTTRVTVLMPGVGAGEAFDGVYRHFERGNAWTLQQLHKRFAIGPIEWTWKK